MKVYVVKFEYFSGNSEDEYLFSIENGKAYASREDARKVISAKLEEARTKESAARTFVSDGEMLAVSDEDLREMGYSWDGDSLSFKFAVQNGGQAAEPEFSWKIEELELTETAV